MSSRGDDTAARVAMEDLCRAYWYPIYGFARGMGVSADDAEDITQGFFERMVGQDMISRIDPGMGKLRSYMIVSLKNFVNHVHRHASRQKRGGGLAVISIDQVEAEGRILNEVSDGDSPDKVFDRRWALALLDSVIERLRREFSNRGEEDRFDALSPLLVDSEYGNGYRLASERLEISEGAVRIAVFRLRKRFRRLVREEVAETVSDPAEIDMEIDELFIVLSK